MAEYEKAIPFKNWSTEDFLGIFGAAMPSQNSAELVLSEPYLFKAGGTYSVPQSQALHFAKQLAVRELHKIGTARAEMLSDADMKENMNKCFPVKPKSNVGTSTFERLDIVTDEEAKPAVGVADANKTIEVEQKEESEDDEADASDDKNNAGAPAFKNKGGRPRKDVQYV